MSDTLFDLSVYTITKEPQKPVKGIKRLRGAHRGQIEFKVECIDDLISGDHRVRDVWEYVSELDLSCFCEDIRVTNCCQGPGTLDPKIAMTLWLFATLNGIMSAREIDRLCREHHAYIWICGGASVNYHTLSDFRTKNNEKFIKVLQESVAIMWKTGTFDSSEIAQDGTRIRADAGKGSLKRETRIDAYLDEAALLIKRLEKELKANPSAYSLRQRAAKERATQERKEKLEKAKQEMAIYKKNREEECKRNNKKLSPEDKDNLQVSITDPECRNMRNATGGFNLAYNVQFATTAKGKVIVGVDVVNTQDSGTLVPMVNQVRENLAQAGCPMASKWTADSAYANKNDVDLAFEQCPDVTFYGPPMGNQHVDGLTEREGDSEGMKQLRKRMSTEEGKEIYSQRCSTAEFSNAVVKNRGMVETLVKGLNKVKNMAIIYAVMHNMLRYWGSI